MEKIETTPTNKNEILGLENRKKLHLIGVNEILSSNETCIILKLKDTTLNISGTNINITKLDTETGTLDADGNFDKLIYGKTTSFFKRIFR
ncbi:MAG: sporulation protein YabP [Clostridiales bacterium]|nr:sporulation protein YabP [Clostridiales bacterium]